MAYLEFDGENGTVLVELGQSEVQPADGVLKAGVAGQIQDNLARAQATFDRALAALIHNSAGAFVRAVNSLDEVPDQIEVSFGIKATGEVGNFAVGKLSGDANYTVKLTWSKPPRREDGTAG
ncbi:hypothetical protein IU479_26985 [Nocardia abscessus]|uniref:CU044_2847 family protein n=1 Tax=Nocardia abscessus TaxID=120957 RepID=UPI0018960B25|nr:CU044_2847 family protein [Nocardia abscessus]MBF6221746.1 hypothetical protein [Nocardia abscessus]